MLKNLRLFRREKHLSQEQLAGLLHISRQTLGAYERGEREPPVELLLSLCDLFSIPAEELCRGPARLPEPTDEQALLLLYRGLDADGRRQLLKMARNESRLAREFRASRF